MKTLLAIAVLLFGPHAIAQKYPFILLQDNDNYKLHVNYKCPTGSQYKIVRENKNPRVKKGLLIYEFELDNEKTISRDSLKNYNYQDVEDLDFENPYDVHELICNNQNNMKVILKVKQFVDGRSRKRFDFSYKTELKIYRARYVGMRYGY